MFRENIGITIAVKNILTIKERTLENTLIFYIEKYNYNRY